MKKENGSSVYVIAAVLLILLVFVPSAVQWEPHPLAPAFAIMEERSASPTEDTYTNTPKPPEAESAKAAGDPTPEASVPVSQVQPDASEAAPTAAAEVISPTPIPTAAPTPEVVLSPSPKPAAAQETVNKPSSAPSGKVPPIPVLNYHSVAVDPGNIVVIHPDKFREHMQFLLDNEYHPLTLEDFMNVLERNAKAPAKPVLLTFDDGYTDNYDTVMPILKEFGFPATLFMSPGMVGTAGYIDWEQAKELKKNGWDIQPHGMTHPSLPKLSLEQQTYEIMEARRLIEENLGNTANVYCYPYGRYNQNTLDILEGNGFRYAFTIEQGKTTADQHPFKLKRIFVNGEEKLSSLVHKLTKW